MFAQDALTVAILAARAAGQLQLEGRKNLKSFEQKSHFNDLVTEVDRECEATIRQTILTHFPEHEILGEEGGTVGYSSNRWIVDPLDGTHNYVRGLPMSGVSIAFEQEGVTTAGVVYDPVRDELFTAIRGQGAFLNGESIGVSTYASMQDPLAIATGFSRHPGSREVSLRQFTTLIQMGVSVRRYSSSTLTLAYVAAGRLDAYWDLKLAHWDTAAGMLLVQEAGGQVSAVSGESYQPGGSLLATNGLLHTELLGLLGQVH
ncbi:inositol monophosphatase family protein [Deinococcus cellulosilyticus]|uniref:Inositol-1-monophosphatase n=1 Tax=Deinococcus cellulosilyticus (strain DSM 18568 / NBRC 106333 / KACC 11606 / 5516J-15) TaxID=1223518 RepID=A0A511MVQ0_DEIC1|nr:inositol monophosphatase family protein [Deinococcus cellulosilyticus]GEM44654.1 inositol monophosphatase [Deinococcus cellulosilyticus NBRC 106333 = KACC 11606]